VLLRSLSAFEIFRRVSRDRVTPLRVVELMNPGKVLDD